MSSVYKITSKSSNQITDEEYEKLHKELIERINYVQTEFNKLCDILRSKHVKMSTSKYVQYLNILTRYRSALLNDMLTVEVEFEDNNNIKI